MSDKEIIAQQAQQISELQASLQAALKEITELKARLSQNSSNSSRPPVSDGLKKKPAFPRTLGKKRGGQQGHRGDTLKMVEQPDEVVVHPVPALCSCGSSLLEVEGEISSKRQVFDLPPQALVVTEHQREQKLCRACGKLHQGEFPMQVQAPVQYGTRVKALVSLLSVGHHLSVGSIKSLFADLFGYGLNEATIQSANALYYEQLEQEESLIRDELAQSSLAHFDESGVRSEGKLHWLHVACSSVLTYFYVHRERGKAALQDQASVWKSFTGRAVHDCWASYFVDSCNQHALCGAHLLRELTALIEQGSQWAAKMHKLLLQTYQDTKKGTGSLQLEALQSIISQYEDILQEADQEEPPPQAVARGRPRQSKGRNLMNRLARYQEAVLAFAQYQEVPFTNNLAERDIRPWKTKLKVSGCFRTKTGADHYARIRGFISTARKQEKQVFEELCRVLNGESFLRDAKVS